MGTRFRSGPHDGRYEESRPYVDAGFLVILVVVIVALVLIFSSGRRGGSSFIGRTCRDCGAAHPPFARFCRRCGKRL